MIDDRIHLILYFFDGYGSDNDFKIVKKLSQYTNIIPVIGKADGCSDNELYEMKMNLIEKAEEHHI
jgi:septin 1 family protein